MSVSEITETRQYLTFKLGNEIFATDVEDREYAQHLHCCRRGAAGQRIDGHRCPYRFG